MTRSGIAILRAGLVTSVGLTADESCAAFRAKLTNPTASRYLGAHGSWIMAHQVMLSEPLRSMRRLAKMAAMCIEEALQQFPRKDWARIPVILCVAERERPGRLEGLEERLFGMICADLDASFAADSAVVASGRVGVSVALVRARQLVHGHAQRHVVIVAVDSLLAWTSLRHYEERDRLLTDRTANGFMPGEGAGALLVGAPPAKGTWLVCSGIGFGREPGAIESEHPLRGDGLVQAIRQAIGEAGVQMQDLDYRITDISGEQYYFKEAAIALTRLLRVRKKEFDMWHPAECTGEIGAASGAAILAAALAACEKRYAKGPSVLLHAGNDAGERAAAVFQYEALG